MTAKDTVAKELQGRNRHPLDNSIKTNAEEPKKANGDSESVEQDGLADQRGCPECR
jgi:hypothetical protein